MSSDRVSYDPSDGLSYDPEEPRYWDKQGLQQEITRAFEICHGCRMCFKYCDSFPSLFSAIDNKHDGNVAAVTEAETATVMDDCFQCKLCEVQCPYSPRDNHPYQLDFPKLVHRFKAVRARREGGVPLREKVLGDPDRLGQAARLSFGMANKANRSTMHRVLMEKTLGIHRDKQLPDFASHTFERWAGREGLIKDAPGGEAVLFQTCFVQNNDHTLGVDTVEVLRRNQIDVRCTKGLQCCGMPAWESGDINELQRRAKKNLDLLAPFVDAGAKVLALNPTCSMMLRREYPHLVAAADRPRAEKLAQVVRDPSEFLWELREDPRFNTNFASHPESVAYHAACHLRAQAIGLRGRDLIRRTGPKSLSVVAECCGHDGTYAMKVESFDASRRIGGKSFEGLKASGAETWVTDCPLAAVQIEQHAGKKPLHPMTVLARSYRGDSFPGNDDDQGT